MSIIHVQNVSHGYGDKIVLNNVSMRLLQGDHAALVGINGAGKSTLLGVLTGELLPDAGRVDLHPGIRIGHLEQYSNLHPYKTIRSFLQSSFAELYDLELEMIALGERMGCCHEAELERIFLRFSHIQQTLERRHFYELDTRIDKVAAGLGLDAIGLLTSPGYLSGGQKTKVLLAKLLLDLPDVLLLDEPTNYLDTAHIEWLSGYLKSYPNAFIVISHEPSFLNSVTNCVFHLEHQDVQKYVGDYDAFRAQYAARENQHATAYRRQQEEIKKLETYIQKNKSRAATAKQAQSRQKRLDKMGRITPPTILPRPRFTFTTDDEPTSIVMEAHELVVGYDTPILPPLDLRLKRGEKVALIGFNGIGKSTLVKTLLGLIGHLGGQIHYGERVRPQYFAQEVENHRDESALQIIWDEFRHLSQTEVRIALAACGLRTEHITQPFSSLSGGEQTKVRLCRMTLAEGNWLVLDEPTNHLDHNAKQALRESLRDYSGTVLIVSHEPDFYTGWIHRVWDISKKL